MERFGLSLAIPVHWVLLTQLYNSYTLYQLIYTHEVTWQVPVLGVGNITTTSMTIPSKLKDSKTGMLKYRFTRLDKYFWSHRKRRDSASQVIIPGLKIEYNPS